MVMGALRSEIKDLWRDERGFTLQEVLTVIAILIILVAIAVIIFLAFLELWRVNAATNHLVADLRLAHTSATNQLTDALIVKTYVISTPTTWFVVPPGDVLTTTDESKIR